ncbi:excinuclease ABC subunit UvrC [Candidatus Parabeggiatoa sp. HSG14]|uniref:excinuclease ABC subunit UvrC n=1 Tax=Candidatus Parabeggiatoa sp. HSG14 TaxID=3055593 RepID=UPI0025A8C7CD|nr:excinuclease ABC subunit UvrC [Thiotrichales bacterium HSG14]
MTNSPTTFNFKTFLITLSNKPGVYCMLDDAGTVLYVGKARHLKKRIASYFTKSTQSPKTHALVAQIANIDVTITHTENEALILENTLIKNIQPRYNILLRDDKSYPYIYLSNHIFPCLSLHRGTKTNKGHYFGPYPHVNAVHKTLNILQKLFLIRQCEESFFRNRSRPCLQYQIKRCTAPCVDLIDKETYQEEVQHAVLFLEGKSQDIIATLIEKMESAAKVLAFEKAAKYRDQIRNLRKIQEHQYVSVDGGNVDVVTAVIQGGTGCVQILTIRDGRHIGNRAFFPKIPYSHFSKGEAKHALKKGRSDTSPLKTEKVKISSLKREKINAQPIKKEEIENIEAKTLLAAFIPQYYLASNRDIPEEIILNHEIDDMAILADVISQQHGRQVHIHSRVRGTRARWIEMALENAQTSLIQRQPNQYHERLADLSIVLQLDTLPQRLECFDVSHTQGEATVASCVVFDAEGTRNKEYRRFNIDNITPGDDYAAMQQALTRRYSRLKKEEALLPDILFVDGGVGQVNVAQTVLTELQLTDIRIIGIAKGPDRKPGLETLILSGDDTPLILPKNSPALHLIQQIRDEAHRFAITSHRKRRAKMWRTSILEEIGDIGPKRRQHLLKHFGGLQGVSQAGVEDLAAVHGISKPLAQKIYDFFQ